MRTCKQWREGDENVCSCGYRWDVKDDDPHPTEEEKQREINQRNLKKLRESLNHEQ